MSVEIDKKPEPNNEPPKKESKLTEATKKKLILAVFIALVVIGIGLISWQPIVNHYLQPKALDTEYTKVFDSGVDDKKIKENKKTIKGTKDDFNFEDINLLTSSLDNLSPKINKDLIVGEIQVPAVNIHLPILYGTTNQNLLTSATTMKPEQKMGKGNYALAGHNAPNEKILFAPLHKSKTGDYIYITDKTKLYKYEITEINVVQPKEISVIQDVEGMNLITLVTCYDAKGKTRLIVQGELVDTQKYKEGIKLEKSAK